MGQLHATMLAELQKPVPELFRVLKLTIGGTDYLYGKQGGDFGSSVGLIEPRVMSWGTFPRGVSLRENALELVTTKTILSDTDQTFSKIIQGSARHDVRGATAVRYLGSPNVTSGNWYTEFSGRVDTYEQPSPLTWALSLSADDLALQRDSIPKATIDRASFPSADLEVYDLSVPIIYGRVDSSNDTNTGAVPAFYVDTSGFRYLVAGGWLKAIDRVYADGIVVDTADYTVTHPTINGRVYTLIDFDDDQVDAEITCDVQGYEATGDGTGALISDPLTVLQHLLVNWIYGDYKSGAWLSASTAPVDTTSFSDTFFSSRSIENPGFYLDAQRSGLEVLNAYLVSYNLKAWWTSDGQIAVGVEDWTDWSYVTDHILRQDEIQGWSLNYPTADIIDRIDGEYGYLPVGGGYRQRLSVVDLSTGEDAPESLSLPFSSAYIL